MGNRLLRVMGLIMKPIITDEKEMLTESRSWWLKVLLLSSTFIKLKHLKLPLVELIVAPMFTCGKECYWSVKAGNCVMMMGCKKNGY